MPTARQIHTYVGAAIAPSVLFFALTGIVQIFSLHEAHDAYRPPAVLIALGSVHKHQTLASPKAHRRSEAGGETAKGGKPGTAATDKLASAAANAPVRQGANAATSPAMIKVYLLKWVFVFVALGLAVSTCIGVYLSLRFARRPAVIWALLIGGLALPLALLLI